MVSSKTNILAEDEIPAASKRLREIIVHFSMGNVSEFAKKVEPITQQRLNRIFHRDNRTKKFPKIPSELIAAINQNMPEVNTTWLLTGEGSMLRIHKVTQVEATSLSQESDIEITAYVRVILSTLAQMRAPALDLDPDKLEDILLKMVDDEKVKIAEERKNKVV